MTGRRYRRCFGLAKRCAYRTRVSCCFAGTGRMSLYTTSTFSILVDIQSQPIQFEKT